MKDLTERPATAGLARDPLPRSRRQIWHRLKPTVLALREIADRKVDHAMIDEIDKQERERKEREALEWAAAEVDDDLSKGGDDL